MFCILYIYISNYIRIGYSHQKKNQTKIKCIQAVSSYAFVMCVSMYTATSHRFHIFRRAPYFALTQWICSHTDLCCYLNATFTTATVCSYILWCVYECVWFTDVAFTHVLMYLRTQFAFYMQLYTITLPPTHTHNPFHTRTRMHECRCVALVHETTHSKCLAMDFYIMSVYSTRPCTTS